MGYFGLFVGALVALGVLFPSKSFERTNKFISVITFLGVICLFLYSVFFTGTLCLLCTGFYVFAILSFFLFWKYGIDKEQPSFPSKFVKPSFMMLVTFFVVFLLGAYAFILFHDAKKDAQVGVGMKIVKQYYELPVVESPSFISPYMTVRSTEKFDEAPIRIIEYADFLCKDCLYLNQQIDRLKDEFSGKINIAFQFFPWDEKCNDVTKKTFHPGGCDLSYMAAYDPDKFLPIHDEIFANFTSASNPEWIKELAKKYQVEDALNDEATIDIVKRIIDTGREYEKTSDRYAHGIRSTPTMILNNRMIIGTFPYEHLRAICQALVEEHEGGKKFIENWVPFKK
jgi:protein-disulfide isomerase